MKKLTISWSDLETAFETVSEEFAFADDASNYFDMETGQVVVLDEMFSHEIDSIMEELDEEELDGATWTEQEIRRMPSYEALPEWMKPTVLSAIHLKYADDIDRFESIPKFESREAFEWMEAFVETVRDDGVQKRLADALKKPKPFRKFRDAMESDRRLQRNWRTFENTCQRKCIMNWLSSIGVEPLNPDESTYAPPPLPDLRKIMFDEVRRFVGIARHLPGVQRISLIGSLATEKEFPKDIDLLVTITDDCDLTELARLGRQLAVHMASHSAGADVFLANSNNQYLGRTCSWKKCGPENRASCDALSCGARHYLHDDFSEIRLNETVIQHPPVTLCPEVAAGSTVPSDVHEHLIGPLSLNSLK